MLRYLISLKEREGEREEEKYIEDKRVVIRAVHSITMWSDKEKPPTNYRITSHK